MRGPFPSPFSLLLLGLALQGCVEGGGRGGAQNIRDFSIEGSVDQSQGDACEHYYTPTENTCSREGCPSRMAEATEEEIQDILDTLEEEVDRGDFDDEPELAREIESRLEKAQTVCVRRGPTRPDGEVFIQSDFCICRKDQSAMIGNCRPYCASVDVPQGLEERDILYGSVRLGAAVELHRELGNLYRWCTQTLKGSEETAPNCRFIIQGENGTRHERSLTFGGNNTFRVDISGLPRGRTYMGKIQETQSGSMASSDSIQFHLINPIDTSLIPKRHLQVVPMSQYSCVQRDGGYSAEIEEGHYRTVLRQFFYFAGNTNPVALDETKTFGGGYFCHDTVFYGPKDSPRYERLEYIPKQFALWDPTDVRFLDRDGDGAIDINKMMAQRLANDFGLRNSRAIEFFRPLNLRPSVAVEQEILMGYLMIYWFYGDSNIAFCPTGAHYRGRDPQFRVIGEFVGLDTEGLYMALRERIPLLGGDGQVAAAPHNLLFIREGQLKDIWFVVEDGQLLRPRGEDLKVRDEVSFYWPPDVSAPTTRKDNQRLYTVVHTLPGTGGDGGQEVPRTATPNDKRIGCVPRVY